VDLQLIKHAGVGVCTIFVDAAPEEGRRLHRHSYEEFFITLEGEANVVANDQELGIGPGDIVIVPPRPHRAASHHGPPELQR